MNIKYLYGKKVFLEQIINGNGVIRFDNFNSYNILENKNIQDDEKNKKLVFNKRNTSRIEIEENGTKKIYTFGSNDSAELVIKTCDCFCKCFSYKRYCEDLYNHFKADICLEIDIDKMIEYLLTVICINNTFKEKFEKLIHGEIKYYKSIKDFPDKMDNSMSILYKPSSFLIEEEYRIALFFNEKNNYKKNVEIIAPARTHPNYFVSDYKERE